MSCNRECQVWTRVVGYHRPVSNFNLGKVEEFKDRQDFDFRKAIGNGKIHNKNYRGTE